MGCLCATLTSCHTDNQPFEVYSLMNDVTDTLRARPNNKELFKLLNIKDRSKHITFRYSEISDVSINEVFELTLTAERMGLFSNAVRERVAANMYERNLAELIVQKDSATTAHSHSAIFDPIMKEIQYLGTLPNGYRKTLIIYSDLMENNSWVSFYKPQDRERLFRSPNQLVKHYIKRAGDKQDIQNLSVNIIYLPRDNRDSDRYSLIQYLYTEVFRELGIPISFSGNLTNAAQHHEYR